MKLTIIRIVNKITTKYHNTFHFQFCFSNFEKKNCFHMWQTLNSKESFLLFLKLAVKNNAKFATNHHSHCFQNEIKPQSQIDQVIKQNIKRISPNRLGQHQTRSQDP